MGFTKNGCVMKMLKTQKSKKILMEMGEGRWRSLEKCFLWEEMVSWRRKIKGKKKLNSANGGRKVDGRIRKKRDMTELTQSTQKKKIFFKVFKYLLKSKVFNSRFSFSNFLKCLNFKFKSSVFKKFQTSDFMIKIPSLNFQNSKAQNFRFQIPNFNSKSQISKVSKFEIKISKLQSFKNQMFSW